MAEMKNSKKIGDVTVKNSGEIYLINGKEYKAEEVEYDYYTISYQLKDEYSFVKGIIGFDEKSNFIFDTFIQSYLNVKVYDQKGNSHVCLNNEIVEKNKDYIRINDGTYKHKNSCTIIACYEDFLISKDFKSRYDYGVGPYIDKYMEYHQNSKMKPHGASEKIAKLLNGLSVGVEFETSRGLIDESDALKAGLIPLRDGSIDGLEYVTIPLEGAYGMQLLINSLDLLKKRTSVDHKCALHFHFGNIPRTKEFIVAFWILSTLYQKELYAQQPAYKQDSRGFKNKNYSYELPLLIRYFNPVLKGESLDAAYNKIIGYLGMNLIPENTNLKDINVHPADPSNRQKWNIKTRYMIINLIPLIFGNKKTVEFRHHEITLNESVVISEMLINAAIVRYAKENTKSILENQESIPNSIAELLEVVYRDETRAISNIFEITSHKRSDICNNFQRGDLFFDSTNYNYRSVYKSEIIKNIFDKKFEIDFWKKYNSNDSFLRFVDSTSQSLGRATITRSSNFGLDVQASEIEAHEINIQRLSTVIHTDDNTGYVDIINNFDTRTFPGSRMVRSNNSEEIKETLLSIEVRLKNFIGNSTHFQNNNKIRILANISSRIRMNINALSKRVVSFNISKNYLHSYFKEYLFIIQSLNIGEVSSNFEALVSSKKILKKYPSVEGISDFDDTMNIEFFNDFTISAVFPLLLKNVTRAELETLGCITTTDNDLISIRYFKTSDDNVFKVSMLTDVHLELFGNYAIGNIFENSPVRLLNNKVGSVLRNFIEYSSWLGGNSVNIMSAMHMTSSGTGTYYLTNQNR